MRQLSIGDLSELSTVPVGTLAKWCRKGVLKPLAAAEGTGNHRRFSVAQATALMYAAEWHERGAGIRIVENIIDTLTPLSDEELLNEFARGNTHLLPPLEHLLHLPKDVIGTDGETFNVQRVYRQAIKRIREMEKRPKSVRGRSRGLVKQ